MSKVLSSIFSRVYIVYVQDLRSGQKVHINADGVIEERSARVARRYISCRINGIRFVDEKNRIAVSLEQAFFFAARSAMFAVSDCAFNGIWPQKVRVRWWNCRVRCSGESRRAGGFALCVLLIAVAEPQ